MKISELIRKELILPEIRASRKEDVIRELSEYLARQDEGVSGAEVTKVLLEREKLGSTALGDGIAVPHGKLETVQKLVGCLGRSRRGIDFGAEDGKPTHFLFVIVAPPDCAGDHLKALARISRLFKDPDIRGRLMAAETAADLHAVFEEADAAAQQR